MNEIAVRVNDLWKYYGRPDKDGFPALRGLSMEVMKGEVVVIYGRSGSGKTTLLNIISGLDIPTRGKVEIFGKDINSIGERGRTALRRLRIGFVFQFFNLLPTLTAFENVMLSLELCGIMSREVAFSAISSVGLEGKEMKYPHELSGGEQQRVAIARAIVKSPWIILADEPTGNLDTRTGDQILDLLLKNSIESGVTLIMATHSPRNSRIADRILKMVDGLLVEGKWG
jgi:putative ABC transport system ATP-binding protein